MPLIPFYNLDGDFLKFEYEGIYMVCFHCGKYGHAKETCLEKKRDTFNQQNREKPSGDGADGAQGSRQAGHGCWWRGRI